MKTSSRIELDSINANGIRLTTFVVTFPRFILPEINTHRAISKNTASSRAIPISKMIEAVELNPAEFSFVGKNQKGMQADEPVDTLTLETFTNEWKLLAIDAAHKAKYFNSLGIHKQIANRLLEPFAYTTMIMTATTHGWFNFFRLRCSRMAQPEFAELAFIMLQQYVDSAPLIAEVGYEHIPFNNIAGLGMANERDELFNAVGRIARVSYTNHEKEYSIEENVDLARRLLAQGHLSPFEHLGLCNPQQRFYSNFDSFGTTSGWEQLRQVVQYETTPNFNVFDDDELEMILANNKPEWLQQKQLATSQVQPSA